LGRIRKAQAKGKQDVRLNKEELAALERRRKRLQAEVAKKKKDASSGSDRRRHKEGEERYAVPISHFDPPQPTRRRGGPSVSDDALPRHPSPATVNQGQQRRGPPVGFFPPPSAPQNRPRSTTSSSHRSRPDEGRSSPFDYQYVNSSPDHRHVSDPSARPQSYRPPSSHGEGWRPTSSSSARNHPDPFQYQTAGPRAPYPYGAAAVGRNLSAPQDVAYANMPRRAAPAAARSSQRAASDDDEMSEEEDDDDTTSDDQGNGAHIARDSSREEVIVIEASPSPEPQPEPERPRGKKSNSSPPKRKPVGGGKRRKGK